jgi:glycerophosphoryl diester phosphodiesterase
MKKKSVGFYRAAFVFFVISFLTSRFVLTREVFAAFVEPRAVLSDLTMAVLIALLAVLFHKIHVIVSAVFLLFVGIFHVASMEMASALNTFINLADLRYAADGYFMRCSLSILTFPWYTLFLLLSVILYLGALSWVEKLRLLRLTYVVMGIFILVPCLHFLTPKDGEWQSSNLLWLSLTRSIARPDHITGSPETSQINADTLEHVEAFVKSEDVSYSRKTPDSRRNVLLIVLEGIPGVYVRQVQEWTGVKYPVVMSKVSSILEKSLIVPNMIAHNRQTMRGLYSILSGDYCKLSLTSPKIYEYLQLPSELRYPCLPEILTKAGYTTAYLQAADLAFMSKNKFMTASGFQLVLGKEFFQYQYVPFGWGPDDKAFFEQATAFVEDISKKSKPWFLTLLNVGTHHPYAVPEEWCSKFRTRKEAAVAYLDEALGDFIERLKEKGILDETLLIITCDESHGVSRQPFGNYWGLLIAQGSESSAEINPGVFGLIDIPYSILDYLDLTEYSHFISNRSIFREPTTDRRILFGSYLSKRKGIVKKRINNNCVKIYQSSNGELFAPEYTQKIVNADEGNKLSEELEQCRLAADSSLCQSNGKDRTYILLENDVFIVGANEAKLLSSGHYIHIPGGTTVTVELEASTELMEEYDGGVNDACVRLFLQMLESYEKMSILKIPVPALKDLDSLRLSFSFHTEESLPRVWAHLKAISVNHSYSTKLTVERYSIEVKECEAKHDFRINSFFIEGKGGTQCDLRTASLASSIKNYGYNLHHQLGTETKEVIKNKGIGEEHFFEYDYSLDKTNPEIVSLKFGRQACEITFVLGELDKRHDFYMLLIHFNQWDARMQEMVALLNERQVACRGFDTSNGENGVLMQFERSKLKESDMNSVSITVNQPFHHKEILLTSEGEGMDVKIEGFVCQPCLPPVAHAGGGYKGLTYTNSIEALEENSRIFQLFEVDFEWTKDDRLIGLHDWEDGFVRIFGFEIDKPLDYDTFCQLKSEHGFTPLDLSKLKEFLWRNPSARIVTDVKSKNIPALKKISQFFPDFEKRFIPQIYQPDEFLEAINMGYQDIIWTLYRYPHISDPVEIISQLSRWEEKYAVRPFAVTLPVTAVGKGIVEVLLKAGVPAYVHTVNSCDEYVRLRRLGVSSIYTDFIDVTNCFAWDLL